MEADLSNFTVPLDTPISRLEACKSFNGLDRKEKLYCHYLSRASWEGSYICLLQTSPESVPAFLFLRELFSRQSVTSLQASCGATVSDEEFKAFLLYSCAIFSNMGNYKSFGDTKIVPNLEKEKFVGIAKCSKFYDEDPALFGRLWEGCGDAIFSLSSRERQLGLGEEGISTYYSGNCVTSDAEFVQAFMKEKDIESYNTRLFKCEEEEGGKVCYELRLASAMTNDQPCDEEDHVAGVLGEHSVKTCTIKVTRGDFAPLMQSMIDNLEKAKEYAGNDNQAAMLEHYIRSFRTGSVLAHKEGSRHWIRDKGPIVESYIGFIESYRDPFGVRGEFEGFVAVVDKVMSAKFGQLVDAAEGLLPLLPWPTAFEKDKFLRPDFTSLDIVTFASSGIPAGINIPNYDDIRQNEGFKNVSLGNVLTAAYRDKRVTFLGPEDQELYVKLRGPSFEVQVGLHELLGHGSGKLLKQEEDGSFNFDKSSVTNPFTGDKRRYDMRHEMLTQRTFFAITHNTKRVTSWYAPGDTWDSKFRSMASSYEECRAECVGIFLCLSREVLSIFGHEGSAAGDIIYVNWLNMVRAGLVGLEYYTPQTKKWRQAHMQARHVILRVLLERSPGLVTIERTTGADGKPDAVVRLDRGRIEDEGKKAIGEFLQQLQVYKAMADVEAGEELFSRYSTVTEEDGEWLSLRDIVMARKMARRMLVQPLTVLLDDGHVELREFDASPEGIIQCYTEYRTRRGTFDSTLETLWQRDRNYWNCS